MGLFSFFGKIKSFVERAIGVVKRFVPEELQAAAVEYVRQAESNLLDNAARREWVVKQIIARFHVPESIARLVVELAVNIVKKELD